MKKLRNITAILLSTLICIGMLSVGAFAGTAVELDYDDGMINIRPEFGGVYDVGHTFEYTVILSFRRMYTEDWYEPVEPLDTDILTLYDDFTNTVIATANGNKISWTPTEAGYHAIRIELERDGAVYQCYEVYQIGEPWEMKNAIIEYAGYALTQGTKILYNNVSIKEQLKVYFYPAGEYLREGIDYTVKIKNAKGPGKAVITVTGIGKCVGALQLEVDIFSPSAKFKDVNQKGWYVSAINYAMMAGLFNGTSKTTFSPDGSMTRGMFVTVIGRFLGLDPEETAPEHSFVDVPEKQYYAPYVAWCNALGIVNGMDATHFAPEESINREQLCTMIARLNSEMQFVIESMPEVDSDFPLPMKTSQRRFADDHKISSWAREAVYCCRGEEIVNGKPGNLFDPKGKATRAEVATIMLNYTNFVNGLLNDFFD